MEIENIGDPHIPIGMIKEVSEKEGEKMILTGFWKKVKELFTITEKKEEKITMKDRADLYDLTKIKGIGPRTASDIIKVFHSEAELIEGLNQDKVPLRDDVVEKLREHYGVE